MAAGPMIISIIGPVYVFAGGTIAAPAEAHFWFCGAGRKGPPWKGGWHFALQNAWGILAVRFRRQYHSYCNCRRIPPSFASQNPPPFTREALVRYSLGKPPLRAKGRCRTSVRRRGWAVRLWMQPQNILVFLWKRKTSPYLAVRGCDRTGY